MGPPSLRSRSPGSCHNAANGWRWLAAGALLAALAAGCSAPSPKPAKTVEVVVTTPIVGEVMDYQDFTGRLDAFRTVEVRARVTGYVNEAYFTEGELVPEGKVLFLIDPRPYKTDLAQAEANLKLALADRSLQELNSTRARRLINTRTIGKEEFDQIIASRVKSEVTVESMEAARDRAALFLDYTKVKAPLRGRISRRNVDPGNLVKADDTLLTTLVADESIYAYFDVDERTYLNLVGEKALASSGARVADLKLPVLMRLANEEDFKRPGHVDFVDNRLSGNTGTIRMRGVFPNAGGALKAGLFVRIRLPSGSPYKPLLVKDAALQSDLGRKYVSVVEKDNKVAYRPVELGQAVEGLRVIKKGLKGGERVIVEGMQRARAGDTVEVKTEPPPKPPDFPLGRLLKLR